LLNQDFYKLAQNFQMNTVQHSQKQFLLDHPLYHHIQTLRDVQIFMESHVFAVWDFMSLLKTLQNQLTCVRVPWVPMGSASTRFFINEIVLGEESDIDLQGNYTSHFELYLKAMEECGASTECIRHFLTLLQQGISLDEALTVSKAPTAAAQFVNFTFHQIQTTSIHELAALFTYGREDLIPGMFITMVDSIHRQHQNLHTFIYYLKRHIELDGDHHGQLSAQMTQELVGHNATKQNQVDQIVKAAYEQRIALWNGIMASINAEKHN